MPRNVTVVVSQSPQQSPGCRDLEESLVATLLMEDGAEVNVIPRGRDSRETAREIAIQPR